MDILPSVLPALNDLVWCYERGCHSYLVHSWLFRHSERYKAIGRRRRRFRILATHGLAEQLDNAPTGYEAFCITPRGLAYWDRLNAVEVSEAQLPPDWPD